MRILFGLILSYLTFSAMDNVYAQNWLWAKQIHHSSTNPISFQKSCVDLEGSLIGFGEFQDILYIDGNPTFSGQDDGYLVKFRSNGDVAWTKKLADFRVAAYNSVDMMETDSENSIYLFGTFESPITFGNINIVPFSYRDIYLAKYDSLGQAVWVKTFNGINNDFPLAMAVDKYHDEIYVVTAHNDTFSVDGGSYLKGHYITKFNSNGNVTWIRPKRYIDYNAMHCGNNKELYILADSSNSNNTVRYHFLFRMDSTGTLHSIIENIGGRRGGASNFEMDGQGNFILTGQYNHEIILGQDTIEPYGTGTGNGDIFIAKYDQNGNFLWANHGGGPHDDRINSMTINDNNEIFMSGWFRTNQAIIGQDTLINSNLSVYQPYIIKYNPMGRSEWIVQLEGKTFDEFRQIHSTHNNQLFVQGIFYSDTIYFDNILHMPRKTGYTNGFGAILEGSPHCPRQRIDISIGWGLISSYIEPDSTDLEYIFSLISSDVQIVKNSQGQTYIPNLGINNIGNFNVEEGYKVKATSQTALILGCQIVDPQNTSIMLNAGWSIISYLRTSSMVIDLALNSINSDILLVKSGDGNTYIPSLGINTIGDMVPGQGYKIKMSSGATLVYPAN